MTDALTYYEKNKEKRREYQRAYVATNRERIRLNGKLRRDRLKREAIEYLGGKCLDCGIDNPVVLEFHHRDGDAKVTEVMILSSSPKKFWIEVDKCDLICANCHLLRHADRFSRAGR